MPQRLFKEKTETGTCTVTSPFLHSCEKTPWRLCDTFWCNWLNYRMVLRFLQNTALLFQRHHLLSPKDLCFRLPSRTDSDPLQQVQMRATETITGLEHTARKERLRVDLLSHKKRGLRLGETLLLSVTLIRGYGRKDMARLLSICKVLITCKASIF